MKAAVIYGEKDVRIEDVEVAEVTKGKVKVKVAWTGICGSDLHAYHHGLGVAYEEHAISKRKVPLVLGHEFSGTVTEVGEGVTNVSIGDNVAIEPILYCGACEYCRKGDYNLCEVSNVGFLGLSDDGGFAEFAVADAKHFHKLPETMSLEEGALVEPTAVAFHAVRNSGLKVGESAAIFGAGPIGLLLLLCAKAAGAAETFVVDISQERLEKAKELGATHVINPMEENAEEKIMAITGKGVEVAFEAAGAQPTFTSALAALRKKGTLLVVAGFSKEVSIDPNALLFKEAKIEFSLAYANDFPTVIKSIAEGKLDVRKVITRRIKLDELVEDGLELLTEDKSQAKILVSPN
ncbi:butanediol dehydrogenase [Oceanobacillus zhaokaii]|uniref:Butanediol dehydrogenase n=1 Tax=Oceanobacillus zhaokaii TaxID=2052660 RepID=A0A345PKA1_9BACI|nr:2,3-butanediol dehydrogenase [Oceanobacillus zhaokaii]AXI10431.1 butanediol dehydrogenase [Oceanobacillus zhaokaii]